MAKGNVYRSFEVREGFGPREVGTLDLETESRADADARLETLWREGRSVQLFGIKDHDDEQVGTRVLLRSLPGLKAA